MLKKLASGVFGTLLLALLGTAHAATNRFSLISDVPTLGSSGLIYTLGTSPNPRRWNLSLYSEYVHKPLELTVGGVATQGVNTNLLAHYLGVSYAPSARFQFDVVLPVITYNRSSSPSLFVPVFSNQAGVGDVFLRGRVTVWRGDKQKHALAFVPYLTLPTGNENNYVGDKYPRGGIKIVSDWQVSDRWYVAANLGAEARQFVNFFDYDLKGRLLASAGAAFMASDYVNIKTDVVSATAIDNPFKEKVTSPVEAMGGIAVKIKNTPVALEASGAVALVRSGSTPLFRTAVGASWGLDGISSGKTKLTDAETMLLHSVFYFPTSSATLNQKQKITLQNVALVLKKHPRVKLIVAEGHTDSTGSREYNWQLSTKRAANTKDYLLTLGISSSRIEVRQFADTKPKTTNTTKAGRKLNRRVELRINPTTTKRIVK